MSSLQPKTLDEAIQVLSVIMSTDPNGTFIYSMDGRLVECNEAACRMHGLSKEKMLEMSPSDFIHEDGFQTFLDFQRDLRERGQFFGESAGKTASGEKFDVEVFGKIVAINGDQYLYSTIRDITEAKANLAKLEAYEKVLEERVRERTSELRSAQRALVMSAHKAGMTDMATDVMHNVGNLLNSVNTSAEIVGTHLSKARFESLRKVNALISDNLRNLGEFADSDRGRKLMEYLPTLAAQMESENRSCLSELSRLSENVASIASFISSYQKHVASARGDEVVPLAALVEDTLHVSADWLERGDIAIEMDLDRSVHTTAQSIKLMQVLTDLARNAKDAVSETVDGPRRIRFQVFRDGGYAYVRIVDTGPGIPEELRTKVFEHGYSTKEGADGFGLHRCANYVAEMGGAIWAESGDEGRGAALVVQLPLTGDGEPTWGGDGLL